MHVVPLVHFLFCCLCFTCHIQKIITKAHIKKFIFVFSSMIHFIYVHCFGSYIKSSVHCKLIFVSDAKYLSSISFFKYGYPILLPPFNEGTCSIEYSWLACEILIIYICLGLFPGFQFCCIGLFDYFNASITMFLWLLLYSMKSGKFFLLSSYFSGFLWLFCGSI